MEKVFGLGLLITGLYKFGIYQKYINEVIHNSFIQIGKGRRYGLVRKVKES